VGESPTRLGRSDFLAVGALILLHCAFFWRALLLRGFLVHGDICYFFEPAKAFMHESLRAGRLPLWSPYIFCGYPIAAEGQIATFYPPSLLISWLLPSPGAINWLIVSHLLLAAVAMYLLARALGLQSFGACLSAVVFSFSGYLFGHIHHVSLICAAAWLPVVLLFVERARRNLALNGALAGLAWGAAALCGHPQTLFHISLAAIFWIVWRSIQRKREGGAGVLRRGLALAALVLLLGLGLSAVQLLLTANLSATAPHGERGTLEYVTSFSLLPDHLVGLVLPNWRGTPAFNTYTGDRYYWEYVLYIGVAPLLLALVGAATRRGRVFALVALAALILALAKGNPLYHILRFIPGFSDFRAPARHIFLFTFAAAMLAGYGWQSLAAARILSSRRRSAVLAAAVAVLTIGDLFWFDKTLAPIAGPGVYEATPRVVQVLREDPNWGRALIRPPIAIYTDWSPPGGWAANPDGWLEGRVYLPANVPQSFDVRTTGGYAGFVDPRYDTFLEAASQDALRKGDIALPSLIGTRYFLVEPEMEIRDLPAADIPPFRVYRNPEAFPRAFTIGAVIPAPNHTEALAQTLELARQGRLASTAVTRGDLGDFSPGGGTGSILRVDEPRPERVAIGVQSDEATLVVLNERWDPGWRARVDGRPAPLVEVDSVLMGAPVPGGEHTVEFEYRPRGLIVGRAISLVSLALLALIIAASALAGRRARAS
jgi:hypothetical protein